MNKKQWQEQDIEKLLNGMPAVKDTRSKDEVFEKLQRAGAFEEQPLVVKPRKNRTPWLVSVAAVAALAVIPAVLLNGKDTQDQAAYSSEEKATMNDQVTEQADMVTRSATVANGRNAVYQEDLQHFKALPATQINAEGLVIPRTVIISLEQIQADFGTENPNAIELVEVYEAAVEDLHFTTEADKQIIPTFYTTLQVDGQSFYVPYKTAYENVIEALQAAMEIQEAPYKSVLPAGVQFDVATKDNEVVVTFTEILNLDTLAKRDAMALIETLNLTADLYGYQLVVNNIQPLQWENFDFEQPLPKTIGPNRLEIIYFTD